jgi:hypothetical protein
MNKVTTTLAGFALLAAATVAPAFAQGDFTQIDGGFTFSFTPANSFTVNTLVNYNPFGTAGNTSTGTLSLAGGTLASGSTTRYTNTALSFTGTGGTPSFTDTIANVFINNNGDGTYLISSARTPMGDSLNLTGGAPVPEASTVISFGALLALGGLAILRRKSSVQNAA